MLLASAVSGCLRSGDVTEMYVCTDPAHSGAFTEQLATMLRAASLDPQLGRAVDDRGGTNFVLEAKKHFVRVWAQNQPVSPPLEGRKDGYVGVSVDRNQYIVSVQSWLPVLQSPKPLYDRLRTQLTHAGFQVHDEPDRCAAVGR